MRLTLVALAGLILAACGPKLPESGTPSAFDGRWTGQAKGDQAQCYAFTIEAEVKYGTMVGEIRDGSKLGDVWGEIAPDGTLKGQIGVAGVSGASADIKLDAETGTGVGSYTSSQCDGTLTLVRG